MQIEHIYLLEEYEYVIDDDTLLDYNSLIKRIKELRKLDITDKDIIKRIKVKLGEVFEPITRLHNIC